MLRYHRESILLSLLCAVQVVIFCQSWFLVDKTARKSFPSRIRASSSVERLQEVSPTRRLANGPHLITEDVSEWLSSTADPPDTPGAFLHLGKTGGSTLSSLLRNGCHSHIMPKPCHVIPESEESYLSRLSTYYHMPDFPKLANYTSYAFYTLTLRDPLDRTISSLIYTHPANQESLGNNVRYRHRQFFSPCFPDLDAFAAALHRYHKRTPRKNDKCSRSAYRSLHNEAKWVEHLYYDTKYMVTTAMVPNRTILIIRMEHLADDWISANKYLGQTHVVPPAQFLRQHNETLPVQDISATSRQYLCAALADEYAAYFRLIWMAQNLEAHDRQDAYTKAIQQCPQLDLPNIQEMAQGAGRRP